MTQLQPTKASGKCCLEGNSLKMHLVRHISLEVFRQDLTRVDRRRDSQAYPRSLQAFPTYPQCCKQDLANCTNLKPPSPNVVMHVCTCAEAQQTSHTRVARPTAVRNRDWRLDFSAHRGAATWRDWSMGCWGLPGRVEREQRERESERERETDRERERERERGKAPTL